MNGFFNDNLLQTGARVSKVESGSGIHLERNEMPFDIHNLVKERVESFLKKEQWNRYPPADNSEIEDLLGNAEGISGDCVVTSAGGAAMITALLNYFAINRFEIIIAKPSFSLYEYHCRTYNIPYKNWDLNENLEYDINLLPPIQGKAVVLFATPNNPVGNCISQEDFERLVSTHKNVLFLVDEVYSVFSEQKFQQLIFKYSNVVLIRSFSKSFSAAGIRIGYALCHPEIAGQIRKLILQFSLNLFSRTFIKTVLTDDHVMQVNKFNIHTLISERNEMYRLLSNMSSEDFFKVHQSGGNFLLVRFVSNNFFEEFYHYLISKGIFALDVSKAPRLENCLRITIGTPEDNKIVISAFKQFIESKK